MDKKTDSEDMNMNDFFPIVIPIEKDSQHGNTHVLHYSMCTHCLFVTLSWVLVYSNEQERHGLCLQRVYILERKEWLKVQSNKSSK